MSISQSSVPSADDKAGKLEQSFIRAIAWTGAGMWVAQFFSWVSTIFVARLLTKEDYGLFALATVYLGLVALVSEFGLGSSIVILRDMEAKQVAEMNAISIIGGILWIVLSFPLAALLGAFFLSPGLPVVIKVISISFLIASFKVVPDALLQQELRFKLIAHVDACKSLVQALVTVVAALMGMKYWSLVVGYLAATLVGTVLTLCFRRHRFAWPRLTALKPALTLSGHILITRICWYLYSNADFVVAGRLLGEGPLGAYRLAWSISNMPVDKISSTVMRSSQAFFSGLQKDYSSLRRSLLGLTDALATITIPVSIGLFLVADQFVDVVLGPDWVAAALPLKLLALYAAVRSLTPLLAQILSVTGNSGFVAKATFWTSVVLPFGFYFGAKWGPAGIAGAWVILYPISAIPLYWRTFREIRLSVGEYCKTLLVPVEGTLLLSGTVLLAKYFLPAQVPVAVQLTVEVAIGVLTYVAFFVFFQSDHIRRLKQVGTMLRSKGA